MGHRSSLNVSWFSEESPVTPLVLLYNVTPKRQEPQRRIHRHYVKAEGVFGV